MISYRRGGFGTGLTATDNGREAWLPDAMWTLVRLESAVDHHEDRDVTLLCGQLRDRARSAGVRPYMVVADGIEAGYERGDYRHSHALIETALACSLGVAQWLDRRSQELTRLVPRGRLIDVEA